MHPRSIRRLCAALAALMGLVNIVSAVLPAIPTRIELLRDVMPLHLIRASATATVLTGFLLILLADGLLRRRQAAWQLAVVLLVISSALHLLKGLDYEESALAAILAGLLIWARPVFDVPARIPAPHRLIADLWRAVSLYWGYVLVGFFLLRHAVSPAPNLLSVLAEPVRLLLGSPHFVYLTAHARWFERSTIGVGVLLVLYLGVHVLRPLIPRAHASAGEIERVRRIVRQYGEDSLSYFALQDGRAYYFDPSGEAFLSYRLWGNVALVGGDPVGPEERFEGLVTSFIEYAESRGLQPCFLGVCDRTLPIYRRAGMKTLKVGEEALIDLQRFDVARLGRKVRRAARHVGELGVEAVTYRPGEIPPTVLDEMRAISREWVAAKGGEERGFSMTLGRFPRPEDVECEVTVALHEGKVLGFLSLVPAGAGRSWSLDSMRRRPDGPNGLMEFLVVRTAERYRAAGCTSLSLNFASLANSLDDMDSKMLDSTRRLLFERLSGVFQLKSLYQFNDKFEPGWRSRYMAYREVLSFPKYVLAVVQSEDPVRIPRLPSWR